MDPLSVTLGVVTLVTMVKDMVELVQKIQESFAKVSRNLRNAQRVAKDIKEMVEEIQAFCQAHKDVVVDMVEFCAALRGLLGKLQSFEASIIPLLPNTSQGKLRPFIRGWWNNNRIQESILELESDIVKVMRGYMMKNGMRTEVKLEKIRRETSRSLTGIAEDLQLVRRDMCAIRTTTVATTTMRRSYEPSGTVSDEFTRSVIMFAQSTPSTSVPMLRTPDVITEELMTAAYIKLQINSIATTVGGLSARCTPGPYRVNKFRMTPHLDLVFMSPTHLRHHIVRQVTSIRDLLNAKLSKTIPIHAAGPLLTLSIGLQELGMGHEAILVCDWAITLARILIDASNDKPHEARAYLALYLRNQASFYHRNGDKTQAVQAIEEAYTITRDLWNVYGGEAQFQILHSDVLLVHAELVDNQRATKMATEATQVLECTLDVQVSTLSESHKQIEGVLQPSFPVVNRLLASAPPKMAIMNYALSLQRLGAYLVKDSRPGKALSLRLLSIAIRREMVSIYGQEHKVHLALALSSLVIGRKSLDIPSGMLIDMADECIQLLRELADTNPLTYARELVFVLWEKATTLEMLNREAEAITIWEEVTSLAGQIIQDSEICAIVLANMSIQFRRLRRYDDAARTGRLAITTHQQRPDLQAGRYFYLSHSLQSLQRYTESADAARTSVALYRQTAMTDPNTWMSHLADSLSNLAHCLDILGDYSEAVVTWEESIAIVDKFLNKTEDARTTFIILYIDALGRCSYIGYNLEDEAQCLKVCSTAVQYLCRLSKSYPQDTEIIRRLLRTEFNYAYSMLRIGHLHDAQQYIDQWSDMWNSKPEAVPESEIAAWHAQIINVKPEVLDAQGCTKQALLASKQVHNIVAPYVSLYHPAFEEMIRSMVQEARLRANLGNYVEATDIAERALQLSRDNRLEPLFNTLVRSLHVVAFTALSSQKYERAEEAAREGCDILLRPENLHHWETSECNATLRPSLFAAISSATANLGQCGTALEYAHRAVEESLNIRNMKPYVSRATAESSYMETRGKVNSGEVLLATGDLSKARQVFEEQRDYFSKRVDKRMGDYRDLAPILRIFGILCCNEGRHDEGSAAAKELSRIVQMLGGAFPSLQEEVKIRLCHQAKVPILRVLHDTSQKLECGHQSEVGSLFSVGQC